MASFSWWSGPSSILFWTHLNLSQPCLLSTSLKSWYTMVVSPDLSKVITSSSKTGLLQMQKCFSSKGFLTPKTLKPAAPVQTKKWLSQNLTTGVKSTRTAVESPHLLLIELAPQVMYTRQSVPLKIEFVWVANKLWDSLLRKSSIATRRAMLAKVAM